MTDARAGPETLKEQQGKKEFFEVINSLTNCMNKMEYNDCLFQYIINSFRSAGI